LSSDDWKKEVKDRIADFRDKKVKEPANAVKSRSKPRFPAVEEQQDAPAKNEAADPFEELLNEAAAEDTLHVETPAKSLLNEPVVDDDDWDALVQEEMAKAGEVVAAPAKEEIVEEPAKEIVEEEIAEEEIVEEEIVEEEIFHLDSALAEEVENAKAAEMLDKLSKASQSKASASKEDEPVLFSFDEPEEAAATAKATEPPASEAMRNVALENLRSVSKQVSTEEEPEKTDIEDSLDSAVDSYIPLAVPDELADDEPKAERKLVIDKRQNQTSLIRLAAGGIDLAIVLTSVLLITWIASMIMQTSVLNVITKAWLPLAGMLVLIHFIYYVLFTSVTGQTLGKRWLNLTLIGKKPGSIGLGMGIVRWLLVMVSILPFFLGFIFMFVNKEGKALHDVILGMGIKRSE
jgi:uncharacterized RDD family membrane protein YckC